MFVSIKCMWVLKDMYVCIHLLNLAPVVRIKIGERKLQVTRAILWLLLKSIQKL